MISPATICMYLHQPVQPMNHYMNHTMARRETSPPDRKIGDSETAEIYPLLLQAKSNSPSAPRVGGRFARGVGRFRVLQLIAGVVWGEVLWWCGVGDRGGVRGKFGELEAL